MFWMILRSAWRWEKSVDEMTISSPTAQSKPAFFVETLSEVALTSAVSLRSVQVTALSFP